uniref:BTB domain-containing protein n=1 Tax=Panagrolaimus sp. ES5 TaxID=591445 RepID=A0AC34FGT8_9BILA
METTEIVCPIDTEWKFKKEHLLALKDSENGFLNGKCFYAFNILGLQYYVSVYPNGNDEDCRGETWIFLYVNGSNKRKIAAEVTISIGSKYALKTLNRVYVEYHGSGFKCSKTDDFFDSKNKFFVNGEITIKVKGTLKAEQSFILKISTPISMQWKIKEEDLKTKKEEKNGCLRSKRICVASFLNVKYFLSIYPNKIKDGEKSKTYLYFNIEIGNEVKVEAVCDFSIDSVNFDRAVQCMFKNSAGYGPSLCSTEDLFDPTKEHIVDGFLTVDFHGILMVETAENTVLNCEKGLAVKYDQEKKDKEFIIVIGDKEIKVHKQVLMDASPVLRAMLESGLKESTENKMIIEDFSFEIVDFAIQLCYSSDAPKKFTFDDMLSLYRFADKYEIRFIMDIAEDFFIQKLVPANVCQLEKFSKDFAIKKLHQSCIDLLIKCSEEHTPVYGSDSLDKDLLAMLFLKTLHPIVVTNI